MSINASGLLCGTFVREEFELFGHDGKQWLLIRRQTEGPLLPSPTEIAAYKGLAVCFRKVEEQRHSLSCSVPEFQVICELHAEFGEEAQVIKSDAPSLEAARIMVREAKVEPQIRKVWIVDLTTRKTIDG